MDGETALWYTRSRYSTNDIVRNRRQQEVLEAVFHKLLSLDAVNRAPELYQAYIQNVTTDLTLDDITPLLPLAASHDGSISPPQLSWAGLQLIMRYAQVLMPVRELNGGDASGFPNP
jgi:anionic cell wall polymer biosynthesis LytR-Cps2A-Psr (LCP) family protein